MWCEVNVRRWVWGGGWVWGGVCGEVGVVRCVWRGECVCVWGGGCESGKVGLGVERWCQCGCGEVVGGGS